MARDKGEINIAFQMPLYPMIDDRDTESSRDNHNKVWNTRLNHFGWKKYLGELYGSDNVPEYAAPARRLYHAFDMLAPGKDVSKEAIGRFEAAFDEARKKYFANNY